MTHRTSATPAPTRRDSADGLRGSPLAHSLACLGLATAVLSGCSSVEKEQAFRPVESSPDLQVEAGPAGAFYQLVIEDDTSVGGARLMWSGLTKRDPQEGPSTAQIALRLRNDSPEPLTLRTEDLVLDMKVKEDPLEVIQEVAAIEGDTTAAPGEVARALLVFDLPRGHDLDDVRWFELHWTVSAGEERIAFSTPFVRFRRWRPPWSDEPLYPYGVSWGNSYYGWTYYDHHSPWYSDPARY